MRRLFTILLAYTLLANVTAWPAAALAEALEHQQESVQLTAPESTTPQPAQAHCAHGCAGHCGQHFQGQVSISANPSREQRTEVPAPMVHGAFLQHIPVLPFRPPLAAPTQS